MAYALILLVITAAVKYPSIARATSFKVGLILDEDIHEDSMNQAVCQVTESYLKQSRSGNEVLSVVWIPFNSTAPSDVTSTVCEALNSGVKAVISALKCPQRKLVSAMTEAFQIPHLSVDLDPRPSLRNEEFTVHLSSEINKAVRPMADLIHAVGCKDIALLIDDISVQSVGQSLIVQLSLVGVQTVLVSLSPSRATDWSRVPQNFVVFTGSLQLQTILRRLQQENNVWLRDYRVWAYVTDLPEPGLLKQLLKPYKNIDTVLVNPNPVFMSADSILLRAAPRKPLSARFCFQLLESQLMEAVRKMLAAFNQTFTSTLIKHGPVCSTHQQLPFEGGIQLLKHLKLEPGGFSIVAIPSGRDRRLTPVGQWSERTRLTLRRTALANKLFSDHLADLKDVTLRVAVHGDNLPYVNLTQSGNRSHHGIVIDMLDELSKSLNFRYVLINSVDGEYGANINGSWSGMIGMVTRGEVDLAASPITVTPERLEVVDFTTPFMQDCLGFITSRPDERTELFQLFKPFSLQVWLAMIGLILVAVAMTLCICVTTGGRENVSRHEQSIQENLLLLVSALCQQGPTFHPSSVSARSFLCFWFVVTILITSMYTAHLAAVLTVSTPVQPINTLEQLAGQTQIGILVSQGSSIWDMFKSSEIPLFKHIGEKMLTFPSASEAIERVKAGGFSYIGDHSFLRYIAATTNEQIRLAEENFIGFSVAFAVPKLSPYKQALDLKIQKMVESGLILHWENRWRHILSNGIVDKKAGGATIHGLERMGGVLIIYAGFIAIATLVLLVERIYNKLTKK